MAMTATSILICVVVLNLHHRDPSAPVPTWLRRLSYNVLAPLVCMRSPPQPKKPDSVLRLCEFTGKFAVGTSFNETEKEGVGTGFESNTLLNRTPSSFDDNGINEQRMHLLKSGKKKVMLEEVVQHLRKITDKIKEKDNEKTVKADWKNVAKILDRFFLMVFVCLVIISSVVLLYVYPMSARERNEAAIFGETHS